MFRRLFAHLDAQIEEYRAGQQQIEATLAAEDEAERLADAERMQRRREADRVTAQQRQQRAVEREAHHALMVQREMVRQSADIDEF